MAHHDRQVETLRVILEHGGDTGFITWLSGQFGAVLKRFDAIDNRLNQLETTMSAQTDKLIADVTDLINEAVADITRAIAAAQNQSPDPAIDALDAKVTQTTQALKDAVKALDPAAPASGGATPPPASPAPSGGGL